MAQFISIKETAKLGRTIRINVNSIVTFCERKGAKPVDDEWNVYEEVLTDGTEITLANGVYVYTELSPAEVEALIAEATR